MSHKGSAPLQTATVEQAQVALHFAKNQVFKLADEKLADVNVVPAQYYVVNEALFYDKNLTAQRARNFSAYYDEGTLPKLATLPPKKDVGRFFRRTVLKEYTSYVLVTARCLGSTVEARRQLRSWAFKAGEQYRPDSSDRYWDLECSCEHF